MAVPNKNIDPEDEIFWRELKEAVKQVELSHGLSMTIERGTRAANIRWIEEYTDHKNNAYVSIVIYEVEPKQPALLVP